ncbi:YjjW family glycine radical enzyme activase [Vibrio sp. JPW-9-11-11]|uniref:YjjW family glycine radical enzyme activase n=1 Tax=Vibrio sp. JPW-9-11-11 TaxID=1416532 RepID=UPI00159451FA|nr:YjjW family glycine radical enzyme activase [Vibrio sp. JPW-9-11-11]NVD06747.1 YjjW family glycine radical enzyme activase [Vibrio sp. JPW-9-11-11]
MTNVAKVSRILNFSCVDGPGNRMVIFLQGCHFRCLNCHNPHTINHCNHCGDCVTSCPSQALSVDNQQRVHWDASACTDCDLCIEVCQHQSSPKVSSYTVTELLRLITKQNPFINGVTLSGGEATLQLPFLIDLFGQIKADPRLNHLTCFVDSNGDLSEQGWRKLAPVVDGVMVDLKSWQEDTHRWLVGRSNQRVIQSLYLLAQRGKLHEIRLLHIPGISDLEEEIEAVAAVINRLPTSVIVRLNAFQHHGVVGEALSWPKCSEQQMVHFHQLLAKRIQNPIILPSVYT